MTADRLGLATMLRVRAEEIRHDALWSKPGPETEIMMRDATLMASAAEIIVKFEYNSSMIHWPNGVRIN